MYLQNEILIGKCWSINAFATSAIIMGDITALHHKLGYSCNQYIDTYKYRYVSR